MIKSVFSDVYLPDYIFRHEFDLFYVFEVDVISCTSDFFDCLKNFLHLIGEDSFSVKNRGPFHLGKGNDNPEVYFPVYEHHFSTFTPTTEIEKKLKLYYYGDSKQFGQDYLQIAWDGVIEGDLNRWALHFERPNDLSIIGMHRSLCSAFESAFLSNSVMRSLYMENLREIQGWTMREEAMFQTLVRNYFPNQVNQYQPKNP